MCGMIHSHVWHGLCHRCVIRVTHVSFVSHMYHSCQNGFLTCGMTHSYVWHDSFVCVTWLMESRRGSCHTCIIYVAHVSFVSKRLSNVWYDSFVCVTWFVRMCDMTHGIEAWFVSHMYHLCRTCINRVTHAFETLRIWHRNLTFSRALAAAYCNSLQRSATHFNTLQHPATRYITCQIWLLFCHLLVESSHA